MTTTTSSPSRRLEDFWGEIAPCEHLVQFYDSDGVFLDLLEGFVSGGLRGGESVIVIATPEHRHALDRRLADRGLDLEVARAQDQYIALDAEETMSKFLVRGWPDEYLFTQLVTWLLARAKGNGRRVRAFGEMVALMWGRGQQGAVVRLEHLWHKLCAEKGFPLLCAYPKSGFAENSAMSLKEICAAHSRFVAPTPELTSTVVA